MLSPVRNLAQGLAAQGFSGGAAELGRGVLIEYRMATRKFRWEAFIRRMLRGFDTATGRLDPGERELLTGRAYTQAPSRQALPPYSETEWDRLTTHLAMRDRRTWSGQGRATIDPNHSPQVEGDHYLTAATPSPQRAVEALVEDAQHD
ncbi:hypothetical protein PZB75_00540 [Streptomyces sp. AM 4-1-1]|uniref:hypothetical protein n=1 Tax=Streptomyces sp. AM 4-1-1 TaxID=3028710 RepID=UPI0023B99CC5|nr:hypothetical protein [Streptomyces sp. AM 4-1-1]WEH31996.1 hypothetical protein PZB75_00540 [Streptomyces sp. AM 4-1-1]